MITQVDIDNALTLFAGLLDRLENPDAIGKGRWYCAAKQQDFLLKLADHMDLLMMMQKLNRIELSERLVHWENSGGIRTDDEGRIS